MESENLVESAEALANSARSLAQQAEGVLSQATQIVINQNNGGENEFIYLFTVFVLAVFVGYYVVWNVTPALHSPLMSVTNAISSVIIVGALIAVGPADLSLSKVMGFIAVVLASINIFGGFIVTQRMLRMYRKKK
ncbi:MAG: NAD(P) transhydrogenase subunit alpha [Alphaproteobacteria bacterium]|jgi:NAD(P) transhydrogenase subunit alpha|nr:NAD(P) transhydrogenase subunit alpha [Alphaproteobacteria bacterium]